MPLFNNKSDKPSKDISLVMSINDNSIVSLTVM